MGLGEDRDCAVETGWPSLSERQGEASLRGPQFTPQHLLHTCRVRGPIVEIRHRLYFQAFGVMERLMNKQESASREAHAVDRMARDVWDPAEKRAVQERLLRGDDTCTEPSGIRGTGLPKGSPLDVPETRPGLADKRGELHGCAGRDTVPCWSGER